MKAFWKYRLNNNITPYIVRLCRPTLCDTWYFQDGWMMTMVAAVMQAIMTMIVIVELW